MRNALEYHSLSDGGAAILSKFGRTYAFTRVQAEMHAAPDVYLNLKKDEAYKLLADTLKADVLELD